MTRKVKIVGNVIAIARVLKKTMKAAKKLKVLRKTTARALMKTVKAKRKMRRLTEAK